MKVLVASCLLLMATLPARAADHEFWISVGVLAGANAADAFSSRGGIEANPLLGRGQFGARQCGVKFGVVTAVVAIELLLPRHRKLATVLNYSAAGTSGFSAVRNLAIHGGTR
ncbi:MAG TPA: hypothetical protein VN841_29260 [Bryobacteraceae bacterium]|nr:hypothetical protein [Bryobacteraceae bacterium]